MADVGRPTDLTKEVIAKIKQAILKGKTLKQFAEESGVSYSTLTGWTYENKANLSDKIEGWKRDRKILLATKNLEEFLEMQTANSVTGKDGEEYVKIDPALVRVKADMTKFTLETLAKENYSKRSELTGKDGEQLNTVVSFNYVKPDSPNNQTNTETRPGLGETPQQED